MRKLFKLFFVLAMTVSLPMLLSSCGDNGNEPDKPEIEKPENSAFEELNLDSYKYCGDVFGNGGHDFVITFLTKGLVIGANGFTSGGGSMVVVEINAANHTDFYPASGVYKVAANPQPGGVQVGFADDVTGTGAVMIYGGSYVRSFDKDGVDLGGKCVVDGTLEVKGDRQNPNIEFTFIMDDQSEISYCFKGKIDEVIEWI